MSDDVGIQDGPIRAAGRSLFDVHRLAVSEYLLLAQDADARGDRRRAGFYRQRAKHHADCADRSQIRSLHQHAIRGWG